MNQDFENLGHAVLENIIPASQCDALAQATDSLLEKGAGTRQLLDFEWCTALAHQLQASPWLAPYLHSQLGQPLRAVQCTYFDKSPHGNWLVAFHQDLSIPVAERQLADSYTGWSIKEGHLFAQPPVSVLESLVAVRIHLDPSEAGNGPLRVLSGTHRLGRIQPEHIAALRLSYPEVVCTAGKGSALVLKPLLLHASSKATTRQPRRVLHYLFGPPELPGGWKNP